MKKIVIKKNAVLKLRSFFPWVYRNEIETELEGFERGESVLICDKGGRFLALGYINPQSVIAARVLSFKKEALGPEFFAARIRQAIEKRKALMAHTGGVRLIHSEADSLPGLIVDYFDGYLSVQINTAGMIRFENLIVNELIGLLKPKGIYKKPDAYSLGKEGVPCEEGVIFGQIPEIIAFEENGVAFSISLFESQKTGFYLDQRRNRQIVADAVPQNAQMLDLFCNVGGFGIYAAKKKNASITFVDISSSALEWAQKNCSLNGIADCETVCANAFDYLRTLRDEKKLYDVVIIDPPSFAKGASAKEGAYRGFKDLAVGGLKLLKPGGLMAIFSCSHHISMEDLGVIALDAATDVHTILEVIDHLYQDSDHPHVLNIPHSLYLKGLLLRKISW